MLFHANPPIQVKWFYERLLFKNLHISKGKFYGSHRQNNVDTWPDSVFYVWDQCGKTVSQGVMLSSFYRIVWNQTNYRYTMNHSSHFREIIKMSWLDTTVVGWVVRTVICHCKHLEKFTSNRKSRCSTMPQLSYSSVRTLWQCYSSSSCTFPQS